MIARPSPERRAGSPDASMEVPAGPPATPGQSVDAFTAALGHGDLETARNCLAPDVTLITPDATAVTGRGTVRGVLAQSIGGDPRIDFELGGVIESGSVAFAQQRWRISSEPIAGSPHLQFLPANFVHVRVGARWNLSILATWDWAGSAVATSPADMMKGPR